MRLALPLLLFSMLGGGCGLRPTPSPWSSPLPSMEPPELPELPTVDNDCDGEAAYRPGEPAPYTDAVGVVECAGVLLPVTKAAKVYRAGAELLPYWKRAAQIERDAREADRAHADRVVQLLDEERRDYRREVVALRFGVVGAFIGGAAVGALAAMAAGQVGP